MYPVELQQRRQALVQSLLPVPPVTPLLRPVDLPVPTGNVHHSPRPPGPAPQPGYVWSNPNPQRPNFYRWIPGPIRPEPPGNMPGQPGQPHMPNIFLHRYGPIRPEPPGPPRFVV